MKILLLSMWMLQRSDCRGFWIHWPKLPSKKATKTRIWSCVQCQADYTPDNPMWNHETIWNLKMICNFTDDLCFEATDIQVLYNVLNFKYTSQVLTPALLLCVLHLFNVPVLFHRCFFLRYLATRPRRPVLVGAHRSNPICRQRLQRGPQPPEFLPMISWFRGVLSGWYLENIGFNTVLFRQLGLLVLGIKLMEINSNLVSRCPETKTIVLTLPFTPC